MTELEQRLYGALSLMRNLVREGGVPRYTVIPGAALNSVIEEIVDPLIRECERANSDNARGSNSKR